MINSRFTELNKEELLDVEGGLPVVAYIVIAYGVYRTCYSFTDGFLNP